MRSCPYATLDPLYHRVGLGAAFLEHGRMPTSGGWRDQSATFMVAAGMYASRRSKLTAPKGGDGGS